MRPPEDLPAARQLPDLKARFEDALTCMEAGISAEHCRGPLCSGAPDDICACPCTPCEQRRVVMEDLLAEVVGAHAAAPLAAVRAHHAAERAEALALIACRWRAWQAREQSPHCLGSSCLKEVDSCGCGCARCADARAHEHCLRSRCLHVEPCSCPCAPCEGARAREHESSADSYICPR